MPKLVALDPKMKCMKAVVLGFWRYRLPLICSIDCLLRRTYKNKALVVLSKAWTALGLLEIVS